jgi:hypothetical protein
MFILLAEELEGAFLGLVACLYKVLKGLLS